MGSDSLFSSEHELILYKQAILKHSEIKDPIINLDNKKLQYLRKVILTSHTLDLRRLVKSEFNESTVMENVLFNGLEKRYKPLAIQFFIDKFTLSYLDVVLKSLNFEQFDEKIAHSLLAFELSEYFIPRSIIHFANLVKPHLPISKEKYSCCEESLPLFKLINKYESSKKSSLSLDEKMIFSVYYAWLSKYILL